MGWSRNTLLNNREWWSGSSVGQRLGKDLELHNPEEFFFFWLRRGLGSVGGQSYRFFFSLERTPSTKRRTVFLRNLEQKLSATLAGDPDKRRYGPKSDMSEFYTVLQQNACYIAPFTWATILIYTFRTGQEILAETATWANKATQTRYYITKKKPAFSGWG